MVESGLSRARLSAVCIVTLAGLIALFGFTRGALVGEIGPGLLSYDELFTLAFLAGAWSTLVVVLAVNQFTHRRWGVEGVQLKPLG